MHVIMRNMALYDLHFIRPTYLTDQLPHSLCNIGPQDLLAVFGDPNNVVFNVVYGMTRFPVILHTASILKSSPEGEGFSPNPRWGQ